MLMMNAPPPSNPAKTNAECQLYCGIMTDSTIGTTVTLKNCTVVQCSTMEIRCLPSNRSVASVKHMASRGVMESPCKALPASRI